MLIYTKFEFMLDGYLQGRYVSATYDYFVQIEVSTRKLANIVSTFLASTFVWYAYCRYYVVPYIFWASIKRSMNTHVVHASFRLCMI